MLKVRLPDPVVKAQWDQLGKDLPSLQAAIETAVNAGKTGGPLTVLGTSLGQQYLQAASKYPNLPRWLQGTLKPPTNPSARINPLSGPASDEDPMGWLPGPQGVVGFNTPVQRKQWDLAAADYPTLMTALNKALVPGIQRNVDAIAANATLVSQYRAMMVKYPELGQWVRNVLGVVQAGRLIMEGDPGAWSPLPGMQTKVVQYDLPTPPPPPPPVPGKVTASIQPFPLLHYPPQGSFQGWFQGMQYDPGRPASKLVLRPAVDGAQYAVAYPVLGKSPSGQDPTPWATQCILFNTDTHEPVTLPKVLNGDLLSLDFTTAQLAFDAFWLFPCRVDGKPAWLFVWTAEDLMIRSRLFDATLTPISKTHDLVKLPPSSAVQNLWTHDVSFLSQTQRLVFTCMVATPSKLHAPAVSVCDVGGKVIQGWTTVAPPFAGAQPPAGTNYHVRVFSGVSGSGNDLAVVGWRRPYAAGSSLRRYWFCVVGADGGVVSSPSSRVIPSPSDMDQIDLGGTITRNHVVLGVTEGAEGKNNRISIHTWPFVSASQTPLSSTYLPAAKLTKDSVSQIFGPDLDATTVLSDGGIFDVVSVAWRSWTDVFGTPPPDGDTRRLNVATYSVADASKPAMQSFTQPPVVCRLGLDPVPSIGVPGGSECGPGYAPVFFPWRPGHSPVLCGVANLSESDNPGFPVSGLARWFYSTTMGNQTT